MVDNHQTLGTQARLTRPGGSFTKYRQAVVDNKGFVYFIFYEFLTTFIAPIPGKIGVRLRQLFYPFLFKEFGRNIVIKSNVVFRRPASISIEDSVQIDSKCSLDVKGEHGTISLGPNVQLGEATILSCAGGDIAIGKATRLGKESRLGAYLGLTIGKSCVFEDFCYTIGAGHSDKDVGIAIIDQKTVCKGKTSIGNDVLVGRCSTILDGVTIGNEVVILPNSLVAKDVASSSRVSGVPAKVSD